jgi:5-oxoprolinase (ATP-hydrolysing) subunit A
MAARININADTAEGFGPYDIGADMELVRIIKSANVACGLHAGDWNTMHRYCLAAKAHGVSVGAHPGFDDRFGFGRRQIRMNAGDLERMVAYQIGALQAIAAMAGMRVTHLKAHGALSNMASSDRDYAMAIGRAIKAVDPALIFVVLPATELEVAARELGLTVAREGFADRQYEDNLHLASRAIAGTVYGDPAVAAAQALRMVRNGEVVARSGKVVKIAVDTICIHGDEPTAVSVATAVRAALESAGIEIVSLPELILAR